VEPWVGVVVWSDVVVVVCAMADPAMRAAAAAAAVSIRAVFILEVPCLFAGSERRC